MITRLIREESGQSAVEYALISAVLVMGLFAAARSLQTIQGDLFRSQHQALRDWRAP